MSKVTVANTDYNLPAEGMADRDNLLATVHCARVMTKPNTNRYMHVRKLRHFKIYRINLKKPA